MTLVVTGFEPFGGWEVNASQLVVAELGTRSEPGIVTAVLPTSYARVEHRIADLLRTHQPDLLLMLGLAARTDQIRLERVAINLDDSDRADNDGEVRAGRPIIEGAPPRYRSTLLLDRMAEIARCAGEEVSFSEDAGGYVCNHAMFVASHLMATSLPDSRCGFVHLPPMQAADDRLLRISGIVRQWLAEHAGGEAGD